MCDRGRGARIAAACIASTARSPFVSSLLRTRATAGRWRPALSGPLLCALSTGYELSIKLPSLLILLLPSLPNFFLPLLPFLMSLFLPFHSLLLTSYALFFPLDLELLLQLSIKRLTFLVVCRNPKSSTKGSRLPDFGCFACMRIRRS